MAPCQHAVRACAFLFLLLWLASLAEGQSVSKCANGLQISLDYEPVWLPNETSGGSRVGVIYHLSKPESASAVSIQIWDGMTLLHQQPAPVKASGEVVWKHYSELPTTPADLQMGAYDPEKFVSCIDYCVPHKGAITSLVLAGTAPDGNRPYPQFQSDPIRLVEGQGSVDVVLEGYLLGPDVRALVSEQDTTGKWIGREYLPTELIDLHHVRVQIPSASLLHPAHLGLNAVVSDEDENPGSRDNIRPEVFIQVVSQDSPVIASIEPAEISADELPSNRFFLRILGNGFTPTSKVLSHRLPSGDWDNSPDYRTQFVSEHELRFRIFAADVLYDTWVSEQSLRLWVGDRNALHISASQELRILPSANFAAYPTPTLAEITRISPYPVPLMDARSRASVLLTVEGHNFRPDNLIEVLNANGPDFKLKTEYISSQELHAWLPASLWQEHRLRYRLTVQTLSGSCTAEVVEDYDN